LRSEAGSKNEKKEVAKLLADAGFLRKRSKIRGGEYVEVSAPSGSGE